MMDKIYSSKEIFLTEIYFLGERSFSALVGENFSLTQDERGFGISIDFSYNMRDMSKDNNLCLDAQYLFKNADKIDSMLIFSKAISRRMAALSKRNPSAPFRMRMHFGSAMSTVVQGFSVIVLKHCISLDFDGNAA